MTIYAVDETGKRLVNHQVPITNDGTFDGYEALLEILEMHLRRLGIAQAKQVLLIADGAPWIWQHIPPLLQRLGCRDEQLLQLIDFYHASDHLWDFAQAIFDDNHQAYRWYRRATSDLKRGRCRTLIERMVTTQVINDPHPLAPSPHLGEGEPERIDVPLPKRERDLGCSRSGTECGRAE